MTKTLITGRILHFLDFSDGKASYAYFEKGALLIGEDGKVVQCGYLADIEHLVDKATIRVDYGDKLLIPGFIDTHIHYPQIDVIASPGKNLLDWLERFTFPSEAKYSDSAWCAQSTDFFLDELVRNGTTSALVFGTVHPQSVDTLFQKAYKRNIRLLAGKVSMDRNCPEYLQDTPHSSFEDANELIHNWHLKGRLQYAITPRFAITSSEKQLERLACLASLYPDMVIQTHLAENIAEVNWIKELFPKHRSYLDVYDHYGFLRPRAIFAHSIHLDDYDIQRLRATKSAVAFCPSSNLFLGSGLMRLKQLTSEQVLVSLATDVGGGTSFSMLKTMARAHEVAQLRGHTFSAFDFFYLATLGGAKAIGIDQSVGNFLPGKEADFIVLDMQSTPILERRIACCQSFEEELFVTMILGDDRNIVASYLMGNIAYQRSN